MKQRLDGLQSTAITPKELLRVCKDNPGHSAMLYIEANGHYKRGRGLMSVEERNFLVFVLGDSGREGMAEARELLKLVSKRGNYRSVIKYVVKLYDINNKRLKELPYDKVTKLG
jgi:hypothetical protein